MERGFANAQPVLNGTSTRIAACGGDGTGVAVLARPTFKTLKKDALYYGDNLFILQEYIPRESVDLVYLDPPFKSNANYNIIFKDESGRQSDAQRVAFEDTWHWGPTPERTYHFLTNTAEHGGRVPEQVGTFIATLVAGLGRNQMTAYLVEMTVRLVELHRVLKPTGSLYLHCDPTASHYLKLLLDAVFGPGCFRSEVIWQRTSAHGNASRRYAAIHDSLLFYTKGPEWTWNQQHQPYTQEYIDEHFVHKDQDGRRFRRADLRNPGYRPNLIYEYKGYKPHPNGWAITREKMEGLDREGRLFFPQKGIAGRIRRKLYLDESPGVPVSDIWDDIKPIFATGSERIGYPTQKPLALLKRIIETSSNPGDLVLDPFCGCGTAVAAAHELGRRWVGIDITYLAIWVMRSRLQTNYGLSAVEVVNEPTELEGVRQMAHEQDGRYQFQWWALARLGAVPPGGTEKKGADAGIDGKITFTDQDGKMGTVLVSAKSGRIDPSMVRDLRGTVERERAAMGIFVTLEEPTPAMRAEATAAGFYQSGTWTLPKLQIVTAGELLANDKAATLPRFTLPPFPAFSGQLRLFG